MQPKRKNVENRRHKSAVLYLRKTFQLGFFHEFFFDDLIGQFINVLYGSKLIFRDS